MNQQGMHFEKLKIASFDFTCCEGCQLQLANNESSLPAFFELLDVHAFREISSEKHDDYDIALVEGSISRSDEIDRLLAIRKQAKILVAFGTCACFGGVNSLKNRIPIEESVVEVYGELQVETLPVRKISDIVQVDISIPGCPVAKEEVERIVVSLVTGSKVNLPKYPVCVECKQQINTCLFDLGEICLGSITRAGCSAVCTSGKTPCLGCRGPAEDINFPAFMKMVRERGLSESDLREKLDFHNAFETYRNDET